MEMYRLFNTCDRCGVKIKRLLVDFRDFDKIKEIEQSERLCKNCNAERKHNDAVLDYELRKYGLL